MFLFIQEKNCWLGAGVIVLPRIKIGDNAVVVAGSVATKDLPDNVVAVGNPCHILRKVNEHDKDFILKIKRYIWLNIYVKGSALRNWVYQITIIYFIVSEASGLAQKRGGLDGLPFLTRKYFI